MITFSIIIALKNRQPTAANQWRCVKYKIVCADKYFAKHCNYLYYPRFNTFCPVKLLK